MTTCFVKKNNAVMERSEVIIRPYTHQELATLYEVSWRTLRRWIKRFKHLLGEKIGHYYTTRQVRIIFTELGWPPGANDESKAAA